MIVRAGKVQPRPTHGESSMKSPFGMRGQSMTEYVVICTVLAAALLLPMPGSQKTVSQLLCDSIRDFYSSLTLFISLP